MRILDKKFRTPRVWSNSELRKFAPLFEGDIINVSGWKDEDKEGALYKDYFTNANSYSISNFEEGTCGFQGMDNEIFLDLEKEVDEKLHRQYDVVFNHTTLEHTFEVHTAFKNLCDMSKDIVVLVVPFLQQMHSHYGDYWRMTPLTVKRLFEKHGYELLYLNFNNNKRSSVYIFAIASRKPEKWRERIGKEFTYIAKRTLFDYAEPYIGNRAIVNSPLFKLKLVVSGQFNKFLRRFTKQEKEGGEDFSVDKIIT